MFGYQTVYLMFQILVYFSAWYVFRVKKTQNVANLSCCVNFIQEFRTTVAYIFVLWGSLMPRCHLKWNSSFIIVVSRVRLVFFVQYLHFWNFPFSSLTVITILLLLSFIFVRSKEISASTFYTRWENDSLW